LDYNSVTFSHFLEPRLNTVNLIDFTHTTPIKQPNITHKLLFYIENKIYQSHCETIDVIRFI
jgi:hypothetical protein